MQSLTQIKALLAAHGLRPRHRYGQNFLHDAGKMAAIMDAARLSPRETVLEVGPGTGALSVHLIAAGVKLVAVEIDRDLEPILREVLVPLGPDRELIIEDVLAGKHELNPRVMEAVDRVAGAGGPTGGGGFKLIANLPYNVASPLLVNLAIRRPEAGAVMSLAIVMIQREVADRLKAAPGGKDYGPLSVIIQSLYTVDRITTLSPACFWPQPKVDSAVVRLTRREQPLTDDPAALSSLLHKLFSKRRKQIGSSLRSVTLPAGIAPTDRPESLTVEQLIALSRIPV